MAQFYPPLPQKYYFPPSSEAVLKIGVQIDDALSEYFSIEVTSLLPQLLELDQKRPLTDIIAELCSSERFNLPSSEDYALQFTKGSIRCVTEQNRNEIANGDVLKLSISPAKLSTILYDRLVHHNALYEHQMQQQSTGSALLHQTLSLLSDASSDTSFVEEFVTNRRGLQLVTSIVEAGSFQLNQLPLASLWNSYWQLMEKSATSWDCVSESLITQMANYALGRSKSLHPKALSVALTILEAIVNGSCHGRLVERDVPLEGLIRHLENSDSTVQQSALALMNALFAKMSNETKKQLTDKLLYSKPVRNAIVGTVLRDRSVGVELAHQLHVLQRLTMDVLEVRAHANPSTEKVGEFRKLAMGIIGWGSTIGTANGASNGAGGGALSPTSTRRNNNQSAAAMANDFKKLGFKHPTTPAEDFELLPPGSLALDCLSFLARNHPERFARIILENSCRTDGRDYPFVQTSMQVINRLLNLFSVGEAPQEGGTFYEILFTHENPFEELASYVLVLFGKTWKEMRAQFPDDLSTVLQVIEEQVQRSLNERPRTFEQLEELLRKYSYMEIGRIRENERASREKGEFESKPILELREKLQPDMLLLVRANRLNGLKEGQTFIKYGRGAKGAREKGKFWHWKLSPTEQYLLYEECEEKQPPKAEDMRCKVLISEIERIAIGPECPLIARETTKSKKVGGSGPTLALSIYVNGQGGYESDCFNFQAPNLPAYNLWIDGLCALLNHPMPSSQAEEDVEMLLNMEIKVRLLDLENVALPSSPPPVPPPPPNFDF